MSDKFIKPMEGKKKKKKKSQNPKDDTSSEESAASGQSDVEDSATDKTKSKELKDELKKRKHLEKEKAKLKAASTSKKTPINPTTQSKKGQDKKSVRSVSVVPNSRVGVTKTSTITPLDVQKKRRQSQLINQETKNDTSKKQQVSQNKDGQIQKTKVSFDSTTKSPVVDKNKATSYQNEKIVPKGKNGPVASTPQIEPNEPKPISKELPLKSVDVPRDADIAPVQERKLSDKNNVKLTKGVKKLSATPQDKKRMSDSQSAQASGRGAKQDVASVVPGDKKEELKSKPVSATSEDFVDSEKKPGDLNIEVVTKKGQRISLSENEKIKVKDEKITNEEVNGKQKSEEKKGGYDEYLNWRNSYNEEEKKIQTEQVEDEAEEAEEEKDDEDVDDEDFEMDKTYDKKIIYSSYEDYIEKTSGKSKSQPQDRKKDKPAEQQDEPLNDVVTEDAVSNDSTPPQSERKWNDPNPSDISQFTEFNRIHLKWTVILIALANFLYSMFTCWQFVMNNAFHEYLLSINSINCPAKDKDDWIVIFINGVWNFASFALLFAENEESAPICIFWVIVKVCEVISSLYIRFLQLMLVQSTVHIIIELFWILFTTTFNLISMGIVICQYYRLTDNYPVRHRLYKARGQAYLNREIWFAGEQEFFQSKHAYRWVCRNQTLKLISKIEKLKAKYKRTTLNYRFHDEDFIVDFPKGYDDYRKSYNIKTDIFNAKNVLDFGRFQDNKDLVQAIKGDDAVDEQTVIVLDDDDE